MLKEKFIEFVGVVIFWIQTISNLLMTDVNHSEMHELSTLPHVVRL